MVSHIVIVADARGHFAPWSGLLALRVRADTWRDADRIAVRTTSRPLRDDPKNLRCARKRARFASRPAGRAAGSRRPHEPMFHARSRCCGHTCAAAPLLARRSSHHRCLIATHASSRTRRRRSLGERRSASLGHFVRFDLNVELSKAMTHSPTRTRRRDHRRRRDPPRRSVCRGLARAGGRSWVMMRRRDRHEAHSQGRDEARVGAGAGSSGSGTCTWRCA